LFDKALFDISYVTGSQFRYNKPRKRGYSLERRSRGMLRFRIHDIFLGAILGIATLGFAIFAMGFVLGSSQYSGQPTQSQGPEKTNGSESKNEQPEPWWQRVVADPIAVFTLCLALTGAFQVGLFYVQLKIIRESLVDAKRIVSKRREGAGGELSGFSRGALYLMLQNWGFIGATSRG
jgi:hypothetical protein